MTKPRHSRTVRRGVVDVGGEREGRMGWIRRINLGRFLGTVTSSVF